MMKRNITAAVTLLLMLAFASCKKDKAPVNEEELVTTVKLSFLEAGTTNLSQFVFRDLDGEGGNPPSTYDSISLSAGKTYLVSIQLLNESVSPVDSISNEVEEEGVDHQFYFQPTGITVTVGSLDTDANGLPLGLNSSWVTGAATGVGNMKITLKHKPGLKAAGDAVTVGETDIELDWPARVQ